MRNRLVLLALALSLVPAATASAQVDFSGTLDAQTPKFTWESSGSGTLYLFNAQAPLQQCRGFPAGTDCERVLLNVGAAADLQITLDSPEGTEGPTVPGDPGPFVSFQDVDGYLYKSNAAGEQQGDSLSNGDAEKGEPDCVTSFPSEQCKVAVTPGYYLLLVEYYFAEAAPLNGTAELLGVTPPAAGEQPPAGDPQQPPAQQPPQQQPGQQPAPGPGQPAPGSTLPTSGTLTVDAAADSGKRKTVVKRGVRGRVRCSVQCRVTAVATADKKVARKLKLGKKAVKVATGKATITKAGRIPFYMKLSAKAKKALKRKGVKKFALKVVFTVTDSQGGQRKTITKKITLR
ncbi:MAG TPA: hypothetical protein VM266_03735 [Solirubrobacteraceae bacterium]|nr:hypothetical protein [Solirubrobacteraceae bacterium]